MKKLPILKVASIAIFPFLFLSCESQPVRIYSHQFGYAKQAYGGDLIRADSNQDKSIWMFDYEDDGIFDLVHELDIKNKKFIVLFGKKSENILFVDYSNKKYMSDGNCTLLLNGKSYKCEWKREAWTFIGDDAKSYYIRVSYTKYGWEILPIVEN